jgi:DNA invertase Pin-like site-specific DNA recombinase
MIGPAWLRSWTTPAIMGDTVVVAALDRLGRSLAGIVRTVETLRERGIMLRSLREGIDYSAPVGRMVADIFTRWPSTSAS